MINSSSKDEDIFKTRSVQYAEVSPDIFKLQGHNLSQQFVSFWNLYQSIKKNGIIEPLSAIKYADGVYEVKGGTRRLQLAKHFGIKKIPVIIVESSDSFKPLNNSVKLNTIDEIRKYYKNPITITNNNSVIITNTTPIHYKSLSDKKTLVKGCVE